MLSTNGEQSALAGTVAIIFIDSKGLPILITNSPHKIIFILQNVVVYGGGELLRSNLVAFVARKSRTLPTKSPLSNYRLF